MRENEGDQEEDFGLKPILYKYLRYWYVYAAFIVTCLGFAQFYTWYVNPIFHTETKLLIKRNDSGADELIKQ